jgi:hypothetical protein
MALLNYTTDVPVNRTMGHIQALLVEAGARSISNQYDAVGRAIGIGFAVETFSGMRNYLLPVHSERVEAVLKRDKIPARYKTSQQAERVAWRIVKDWLEAQLAIIRTEMVTLDQVMLPYMQVNENGETVYDLYLGSQLALPSPE